jgi:capsular exopolysaccharide synthesis family protein
MSRIHEALKRAEQEQAAKRGGLPSNDPIAADFHSELRDIASRSVAASGSSAAANSSVVELEPELEQCPKFDWKPDAATMLFTSGNDGTRGTEEFRTLRSRLYHLREKMNLKTVLITSALPKEGKSFTAANLAQVLVRQHGRRVLLIDADLRRPRLHHMLGTAARPGLSDYLLGSNDEYSIMQRGQIENLFFVPGGTVIDNPAELVGNGRLQMLFERVALLFDWIIVDSPPAVPVSDASVLAKFCDGVLMVVRSNSTPADVARKARQEFPEESLVGIVLNGTDDDAAPYARYYYETYEKKEGTKSQG